MNKNLEDVPQSRLLVIGEKGQLKIMSNNNDTVPDNGSLIQQNTTFSNTLSQDNATIAHDNASMVDLKDNLTLHANSTIAQDNTTMTQKDTAQIERRH